MTRALLVLVLGLLVAGCASPSRRTRYVTLPATKCATPPPSAPAPGSSPVGAQAPGVAMVTTWGVALSYPVWVDQHPGLRDQLLREMLTTRPEADPRISPATVGVPSTATVTVLDPGGYYAPYSPTGLALGEWRAPGEIFVAWRSAPTGPLVPALAHELRHLLTQDAKAGHSP